MACCCAPAHSSTIPAPSWICLEQMFRALLQTDRASGNGTVGRNRDSPGREGAEGHRKLSCRISFSTWPEQLEKKLLIKCRLPPEPARTFLKNSPSYETFPVHFGMAKSELKASPKYLWVSESTSLYSPEHQQGLEGPWNICTKLPALLLQLLGTVPCLYTQGLASFIIFFSFPWHKEQTDFLCLQCSQGTINRPRIPVSNVTS